MTASVQVWKQLEGRCDGQLLIGSKECTAMWQLR